MLTAEQLEVWRAFVRLGGDRQRVGMDGAPLELPFQAIDRYAERYGPHTPEDFEWFHECLRALDEVYVDRDRQQRKAQQNKR